MSRSRRRMSRKGSRKLFSRTAQRVNGKNMLSGCFRGGYRL